MKRTGSWLWVPLLALSACAASPSERARAVLADAEKERAPQLLTQRAEVLLRVGDYARAEQYYRLALEEGASADALMPHLLEACVRDGRYRDAIQHAEEYLKQRPNAHPVRYVLASLEVAIGDEAAAQKDLSRVVQAVPSHADAHFALALLLREHNVNAQAADFHFREYLRLNPAGPHAAEARDSLLVSLRD